MSIHYGQLSRSDKTDLTDVLKRLKTLETENAALKASVATNTSDISANNTNIILSGSRIADNTTKISANTTKSTSAYNKAVSNGSKLLTKLRYSQNFEFIYTNPSVGNWSISTNNPAGHPDKHCPLLNIDSETYIHIQFQKFDEDAILNGTEKAEYRISFLDNASNVTSWTSPTQTISASGKKLHHTMFVIDVLCQVSVARPSDWQNLRAFSLAYKPIAPSKVNGNECRLFVHVYSKG